MSDATRTAAAAPPAPPAPPAKGGRKAPPTGFLARATAFLGSFGLAVTLLLLLLVLTFLGTWEQQYASLYDVQVRYFESLVVVQDLGPISIPLPGASLVLALLAVNLVVGGILRMRWGRSTLGILVTHAGILLLLGGSFVEYLVSDKGQMTLYEGKSSDEFQSFYEWEVAVRERRPDGGATEFVLPSSKLMRMEAGDSARFTSSRLPFDVVVSGWSRNAEPRPAAPGSSEGAEGWVLAAQAPAKDAERNVPGAYVTLADRAGGASPRGILWGGQSQPWVTTVGGRRFEVDLRTRRWTLPFRIELKKFVHRMYPGTSMPAEFSSYVVKHEGGVDRDVHVTMNEPLRHEGYTFYQSGWGPQGAPEGTPLFSTFSVVRNPSDRVPLIACLVIAAGLLMHFLRRLDLHIKAESRAAAAPERSPAS